MHKFVEELSGIKGEVEERTRENKPMEEPTEWQKMESKNATRCSGVPYAINASEKVMKEPILIVIFLIKIPWMRSQ